MAFDGTKPAYQSEILSQPLRDNFNYLKTQLDVEHNENGTHKDVLKKSGDTSTGDFGVKKSVPALRLIGTEINAQDIRIVETSGLVKLQKNLGTEASPVWADFFTVNPSTYLIGTARITEANLDPSTQIPDGRLAQIVTAGKIAESALPSTLAKLNTQNTFNNPQIVQGNDAGIYFDNNIDSLYKAEFKKNSDTTASILIKNKSDGSDVAAYSFGADGNFSTRKMSITVPTGTPPLSVSSTTLVNNLYVARAAIADRLGNPQVIEYTIPGTYTFNKPDVGALALIEVWSGGSGGYQAPIYGFTSQNGGIGGGYAATLCVLWTLPASINVTVGAGGLFNPSPTGIIAQTKGGPSIFGSYLNVAGGGEAQTGNPPMYEAGGASAISNFPHYANRTNAGGGGGNPNCIAGGISELGGNGGANGQNGIAPAGGGGYGANGAAGKVRITIW